MLFLPGNYYHVYNQGNNRQRIFQNNREYRIFLTLTKRNLQPQCSILAWCLMPNHFHFLIQTDQRCQAVLKQGSIEMGTINNGIRLLLSGYARIANDLNGRTGSLFRQKTKAKLICSTHKGDPDFPYLVNCFNYIHQNPVKSGLANEPEDWSFSSYKCYLENVEDELTNRTIAREHGIFRPETLRIETGADLTPEIIKRFA